MEFTTACCRITRDKKTRLEVQAAKENRSASAVIQELIDIYLEEREKQPSTTEVTKKLLSQSITSTLLLSVLLEKTLGREKAEKLFKEFQEIGEQESEQVLIEARCFTEEEHL